MRIRDTIISDVTPLPEGGVDEAIQMLRTASQRELREEAFLCQEFLPMLGLNNEQLREFPEALYPWCGKGIRSWQYPIQFSAYLAYLSGIPAETYVEIGCRHGGTFIIVVEYLRRFFDLRWAVAIDLESTPIMRDYADRTAGVEYRIGNSREPALRAYLGSSRWDLAFIDGDHSYDGCMSDFHAVRQVARRIALHDITSHACPGVSQSWREITQIVPDRKLFVAADQYKDVQSSTGKTYLGIGVVDFR